MDWIKYDQPGVAVMFGKVLEAITSKFKTIIAEQKEQLPRKSVKESYPIVYWVACQQHMSFDNNPLRVKFNLCLESIVKQLPHMHVIKIK